MEIKQLQGKKPKATGDIATDIQALKEHKAKIKAKQEEADKWLSVVNMPKQRAAQQHQEEEETQQQAETEHQTEEEGTRNTEATEQQAEEEAQQQAEQQRLQAKQEAEKEVKQFVDHTEEADVDDVVNDVFEEKI